MRRIVTFALVVAACKSGSERNEPRAVTPDAAAAPAFVITEVPGVAGTAYFLPDQQSFWVEDSDGANLVRFSIDGRELERIPFEGALAEAAFTIRTSQARRPVSPDGMLLDGIERPQAFDPKQRREQPLPVPEHATVDWLADGRLLVVELGDDERRPAYILDGTERTPICNEVAGLESVVPTLDGKGLIVSAPDGTFLADLACTRERALTSTSMAIPLDSPSRKAWIAYFIDDQGGGELRVLGASGDRTVGPAANSSWIAWVDDDRFVFAQDATVLWASASSDAPPAPVLPPEEGCRDMFVGGAPGGGVAAFSRSCGPGTSRLILVRPPEPS